MLIRFSNELPNPNEFFALFETTGWNQVKPLKKDEIYKAIQQSLFILSAFSGDRLVGFGRVISDGVYHALIAKLIAQPEHQNLGIGGAILEQLVAACQQAGIRHIPLFSAKGKTKFYEIFGFTKRAIDAPGMELM